nr:DUF4157 domain-containing protein [Chloroflexaceae bacterium]
MKQQRSRRPQEARLAPASSSLASRPFSPDSAVATVARPAAAPHQFHGVAVRNVSPMVQPKLTLGQPDDRFEREAEQIATALVSRPRLERTLQQPTTQVQRSGGATGIAISPALEASINSARGQGQAMPATVQRSMEAAFGADFSGVRVHVDSQAHQLSQAVQAQAFTTGNDIFFRQGHYNPGSRDGQHLLAHELTHVVQQGGSTVQAQTIQRKNFTQEALDDYDDYNEALDDYEEDEEAETPGKHPSDVTVWNFVHQAIHQEGARKVESRTGLGDAHIEEGMIGTLYPEPVADKEKGKASQITVDPKLQPLVRDVQRIQAG